MEKLFPMVVLLCWGAGLGIHSSTGLACDSDQNANIYTPLKLHLLSLPVPEAGRGGFASVKNYILNEYFIIATPKMEKHLSKMVMYLF